MSTEKKVRWRIPPAGKASNYISPLNLPRGSKVVLCCRVSGYEQHRTEKLARQVAALRREAEQRGLIVIDVVTHVGSGIDPSWLADAAVLAERLGATLVAETTDRFIRSSRYSKVVQDAQATEADLGQLRLFTYGVPLATLLHPAASPAQVRSYQRKRGQRATGRRGGRPVVPTPGYKKLRRERRWAVVARLHRRGLSLRSIADWTDVPEATVRRWLKAVI
ncbi:MAG: helix-turn-helix domain-containing protein [Pirellulales bacterium]|nr:helix-turn-helix domain-containing protein [Pirellulales bacterium]